MNSTWGKNIKLSLFGESHGACVGIVIDGIPQGILVDSDFITSQLRRRAPGKSTLETARRERDEYSLLSGVLNGVTTGAPICCIIENSDTKSSDYDEMKNLMRPGHSDYTAYKKFGGMNDVRGGGHFSARLTAPLVFAGSLCRQILKTRGVEVFAHIGSIGGICDDLFNNVNGGDYSYLDEKAFCVINDLRGEEMKSKIDAARQAENSVGGSVECMICGMPTVGNPIFHSVESVISGIMFSIPAVKGVEFGAGFKAASMLGSENNDEFYYDNKTVKTRTNSCGGILGGITDGMPVWFNVAFKPTPTIALPQNTINIKTGENAVISARGRHDPCVAVRGVCVVQAAAAIAALDLILEEGRV